jgi:hypothetical protein
LGLKVKNAARLPRTASRNDPQECGALRQGDIAIIHSAPTGERVLGGQETARILI